MEYYVYTFLDPEKPGRFYYEGLDVCFLFEPFYIGKGKRNRMIAHFCPSSLSEKNFKSKKLNKMKLLGIEPYKLKIYENITEKDSLIREENLILKIGRRDKGYGPLTNGSDGGESNTNQNRKTKKIIQNLNGLDIVFKSVKECAEHNKVFPERISEFLRGRRGKNFKIDIRYKDDESNSFDAKQFFLNKKDSRNIEIIQLDLDGNFLNNWGSVIEASKYSNVSSSSISACCNKRIRTAGDYIWKYTDDIDEIDYQIFQYDLSGNLLKKWINMDYLFKMNKNYKSTTINACIKGRLKSAYGFVWKKNKKIK